MKRDSITNSEGGAPGADPHDEAALAAATGRVRIVLVGTTHPGNIGAAARAMKTMRLSRLWLVAPACEVDAQAVARASGADEVLAAARECAALKEALAGCSLVFGTTARPRTLDWPALTPRAAAARLTAETAAGREVAIVFGPERTGLANADLDHCHFRVTIPANPAYSSLNLAAAVQVVSYEILATLTDSDLAQLEPSEADAAGADEMERFYEHLERSLTASGFLDPANPRHLMRRLRRLFNRARPDRNEINILRGILRALTQQHR